MASNLDFVEFICEQIGSAGFIGYKKMFGEYMVYCNGKPIILVCDNTAFVKMLPETTEILGADNPQGYPYNGAKPHYTVDADDREKITSLAGVLKEITPLPKKKKGKN